MKCLSYLTLAFCLSTHALANTPLAPRDCVPHDRQLLQKAQSRIDRKDPTLFQSGVWLGLTATTLRDIQNLLARLQKSYDDLMQEAAQAFGQRDHLVRGLAHYPAELLGLSEAERTELVANVAQASTYLEVYESLRQYQQTVRGRGVEASVTPEGIDVSTSPFGIPTTTQLRFSMDEGEGLNKLQREIAPLERAFTSLQALGSCQAIAAALSRPKAEIPEELRQYGFDRYVAEPSKQVRCRTSVDFEIMLPIPSLNRNCETEYIPYARATTRQRNEALKGLTNSVANFKRWLTQVRVD